MTVIFHESERDFVFKRLSVNPLNLFMGSVKALVKTLDIT